MGSGVPLYPEGPDVVRSKRRELVLAADAYSKLTWVHGYTTTDVVGLDDEIAVARRRLDHAAAELARILTLAGR
jgi:hypothetical protein